MGKVEDIGRAVSRVADGMTVMVGGFMGCGNPHSVIDALIDAGTTNLTLICNDASSPGYGVAKLVEQKRVTKLVATHVGLNPEVARQMNAGELEVELIPQGTFAECIRAAGAGLGGVLTPTGLGTPVAEGKPTVEVDGRTYLLEKPIRADVALIAGNRVDESGNIWYKGTTRSFSPLMALAADTVIVEADHLLEVGDLYPEDVVTPGCLVDHIVVSTHSEDDFNSKLGYPE
ncbi:MAG: CoA transferase subunit A [Propionibacteriaceae bacterium]|jgi:acetate CoA/acetoacetate CoA-transferase alpha subunit|nr:CoA transferase subunit A [Propionibacteriaceae bacterium]